MLEDDLPLLKFAQVSYQWYRNYVSAWKANNNYENNNSYNDTVSYHVDDGA